MTKRDAIKARSYVRSILAGLVPSDPLFNAIYDTVALAGVSVDFMTDEQAIRTAEQIRTIRA